MHTLNKFKKETTRKWEVYDKYIKHCSTNSCRWSWPPLFYQLFVGVDSVCLLNLSPFWGYGSSDEK